MSELKMPKVTEGDLRRAELYLDGLKKHRAWVTGFEAGSGKQVPFADSLRLLHIELESILIKMRVAIK